MYFFVNTKEGVPLSYNSTLPPSYTILTALVKFGSMIL